MGEGVNALFGGEVVSAEEVFTKPQRARHCRDTKLKTEIRIYLFTLSSALICRSSHQA